MAASVLRLTPAHRAALAAYLFGIAFVPIWVGANLVNLLTVHIALAALCIVSLVLAVVMLFDFDHTVDGLQYVTGREQALEGQLWA